MRCILLNPGPVSLSDAVRRAAVSTDLCHREPEYQVLQRQVREGLLNVYGCESSAWAAVMLGGSGTTAVEAMMTSLLPRKACVLVIENGHYGERLSRIARIHGIEHESLEHAWTEAIDFERVAEALSDGLFTHVAAVHHEATTGRLNDARRLAALCESHGAELVLDTVSSFGAEDIPFESPALTACASTAGKCLHGMPGLCFVLARQAALTGAASPPRSLSLDLSLWLENPEAMEPPFTPPVNSVLALREALTELERGGGWTGRRARYRDLARQVARGLAAMGVEPLLDDDDSSCVLNAYRLREGDSYEVVHDGLKQWGFVIFAGQGRLGEGVFRIATMGDITNYDMERLLAAIETVFRH